MVKGVEVLDNKTRSGRVKGAPSTTLALSNTRP